MRSSHWSTLGLALLLAGCAGQTAEEVPASAAAAAADTAAPFHGAWELASIVRFGPGGEELSRNESSTGFIMYDSSGTMGVVIQGADRAPYAGDEATPEATLAAFRSYTSYFGGFTVDPDEGTVTHHLRGSMNPGGAGSDYVRHYTFSEDRLTLQPPAGADGGVVRLTWRRLPDRADLPEEQRRFVGFWGFSGLARRDGAGAELPVERSYEDGLIVYTASGHMAVHLVRPDRDPFAEGRPTAEEALAAMRTGVSYFGPYTVEADNGQIVHHRSGCWFPGCIDTDARRGYEFGDGTLTLKPPAREMGGRTVRDALTWERLSE